MWFLLIIAAGLVTLVGRQAGKGSTWGAGNRASVSNHGYTTNVWGPVIAAMAVKEGFPFEFGMKWVDLESEGNPCAIGEAGKFGTDGVPLEFGIAQVYNSDDYYRRLGGGVGIADAKSRRAYCRYPQTVTRVLTPAEMTEQAQDLADVVKLCRDNLDHHMSLNGIKWGTRDYWRGVKLYHALPGMVSGGLAAVTGKLGRAPTDWAEFRRTFVQLHPQAAWDSGKDKHHQHIYWRSLQNSEDTGGAVPEPRTYV